MSRTQFRIFEPLGGNAALRTVLWVTKRAGPAWPVFYPLWRGALSWKETAMAQKQPSKGTTQAIAANSTKTVALQEWFGHFAHDSRH